MTSARDGGAFVVERGTGRVLHLDGEGGVEPVVAGLDRPQAVAEAADGSLWISRAGGLTAVANGHVVASIDGFDDPHGIACSTTRSSWLNRRTGGSLASLASPAR